MNYNTIWQDKLGSKYELKEKDNLNKTGQCFNGCAFNDVDHGCPGNDLEGYLICEEDKNLVWKKIEVVKPSTPKDNSDGRKYDQGKPMYDLLPALALEEVVKVLTYGANKYNEPIDEENWRKVNKPHSRYFSAAQRHLWAAKRGEELDESGLHHIAHAITSLMFILQLKLERKQ